MEFSGVRFIGFMYGFKCCEIGSSNGWTFQQATRLKKRGVESEIQDELFKVGYVSRFKISIHAKPKLSDAQAATSAFVLCNIASPTSNTAEMTIPGPYPTPARVMAVNMNVPAIHSVIRPKTSSSPTISGN